jgi:hypothetical protein
MKACCFLKWSVAWLLCVTGALPGAAAEQLGQRGAVPAAGT